MARTANYWSRLLTGRIARRRAIATTGATALGTAIIAACGGGESGGESKTSSLGLLTQPEDTIKQAKTGGTVKDRTHGDVATLDNAPGSVTFNAIGNHVNSSLLATEPGYLKRSENKIIGDFAESWEWSPDGLSVVLKLRQGVRFHNKPPVSGRLIDVQDVLFTWDRFSRISAARSSIVNAVNPDAPVVSLTAPDSRTIVLKLAQPIIYAPGLFTGTGGGSFVMIPKETDSSFDSRRDIIGIGPFYLSNYTPSVGFTLKRFPEYWNREYALVDQIDLPIVPEYAAALAQLKAGNLYTMGSSGNIPQVRLGEILQVKREVPQLLVYQGDMARGAILTGFGWQGNSPFLDERVRQAFSMAIDRDLYLDTFHSVMQLEADGLPVESRWNTAMEGIEKNEGFWLDPKGKDFGPNAKYYQHDAAEAKKLLSAAGFPNGLEVPTKFVTGGELPNIPLRAEVLNGMVNEIGIKTSVTAINYTNEYLPKYRDGNGQWEGVLYKGGGGGVGSGDPVGELSNWWWSKGGPTFFGFSTTGKNDLAGDPELDTMIDKARIERSTERRRALAFDIQRLVAKRAYGFLTPGVATGFLMAWPALQNFRVYQGARANYRVWIDTTKPPHSA